MKKRLGFLVLVLALSISICGCIQQGGNTAAQKAEVTDEVTAAVTASSPSPSPSPTPTPEPVSVNPLTGLPMDAELVNRRPISIMLNNLKAAMPQLGISQADIIYEALVEGGITRMLGVYQSVEGVDLIGSVRSARPCFLELALGHDAIYLHAGGSAEAYSDIKSWGITAFDCVNGPYEGTLFWRDPSRIKNNGSVHSVVTSGQTILDLMPTYHIREEHNEEFEYQMQFAQDGTPAGGEPAMSIEVPFSYYKTGKFTYDEQSGKYMVWQYDSEHIDGDTGEQLGVTNVIILQTKCRVISGDSDGHMAIDMTGEGDGWFACGGQMISIHWSKASTSSQLVYTTQSGEALTLGAGNSYVCIIPLENTITVT